MIDYKSILPPKIAQELEEKLNSLDVSDEIKAEIVKAVVDKYLQAQVDVGEPVGLVAAQSITEPATQMILRSFHFVGISELQISLGLPRLVEIMDGRKKIKEKYMVIHLKEEYSRSKEAAIEVANKIREVKLADIVSEIETDILNKKLVLHLNTDRMKTFGIDIKKVVDTIKKKLKKMSIEDYNDSEIVLEFRSKNSSLKEFYMYRDNVKNVQISGIKGIKDVITMKEGDEWVIYTYGSNLKDIMKVPEVDYRRVFSNDISEVEKVLGIEAAREVIVRQILDILKEQGLDVDTRYILLLADTLTWYGTYKGVTRYGLHAEKSSALARAAFETPMKHFVKASVLAEDDAIRTAIENVMMNQPIPYGTGLFKVIYTGKPKTK